MTMQCAEGAPGSSMQFNDHTSNRTGSGTGVSQGNADNQSVSLDDVSRLVQSLARYVDRSVNEIGEINLQTTILSFNAQIEAARAGSAGGAFGVVAGEMGNLAGRTKALVERLGEQSRTDIGRLIAQVAALAIDIRGIRLSDLALTNIDLIDRNLYERSCDVRWWATDGAAVGALEQPCNETASFACKRLGVILDSYTVYYDIVLCDLSGRVIANGRRSKFGSIGSRQQESEWFRAALATKDGTEFGFQNVHRNPDLADGEHILVYSAAVRAGGETRGRILGVLGIVFNWEALAQTIVKNTLISPEEKPYTRVCITGTGGLVIADSRGRLLQEKLELPSAALELKRRKGHVRALYQGQDCLISHAYSPGYETYSTGWNSWIIQQIRS